MSVSARTGVGVTARKDGLRTKPITVMTKKSTLSWRQSGRRFLEEVSVAGVRFIVSDESTLLRKCIWFFLVLLGGAFMIFQVLTVYTQLCAAHPHAPIDRYIHLSVFTGCPTSESLSGISCICVDQR